MNCSIPTVPIVKEDSIGDSLAKHNYNLMLLDTRICNLSSLYFDQLQGLNTIISELETLINYYSPIISTGNTYTVDDVTNYLLASTTVNHLSAFWDRNTFSVYYPIDGAAIGSNDKNINVVSNLKSDNDTISNMVNGQLKSMALSYLNINFNPTLYVENTVINVIFSIFNRAPSISDVLTDNSHLVTATYSPEFSYLVRKMYVTYTRDNIHLTRNAVLGFINKNNSWNFVGSLI